MQPSVDRSKVRNGGLVGLGIGLFLLALALFFLVSGFDKPEEVLGVYLPLAAALVSLALAAMALIPLRFGDSAERSPALMTLAWRLLAALGLVVTIAAILRAELPWTAFAVVPLLVVCALVWDSFRLARLAHSPAEGAAPRES